MNDENEIIELSCSSCKKSISGTYKELFGDIPSIVCLPKLKCKCGGDVCLHLTGKYKKEDVSE